VRAQEIIRAKREGRALDGAQIDVFVRGVATRTWSEGQVAALAMAICLNGMTHAETVALTRAMAASGDVLDWSRERLDKPVLDKHSTGGVGDKVSLLLAPIVAACGALVPMVSGRGLGHTGGTLDKLSALPGYQLTPPRRVLVRALRDAGCAIVGASARVAPADRRLYAIRDATGTVEALPLITASILSKKLAAGLQALVMDVKAGNGAFCATVDEAQALAHSLVNVARDTRLPVCALVSDMNSVLGTSAGNALEVRECLSGLTGGALDARLRTLTLQLAAHLLHLGGLAASVTEAEQQAAAALDGGRAAECFARMVAALGGPHDVLERADSSLPRAPVQRALLAPRDGVVAAMDTRGIGLIVVALGGGRARAGDAIDVRVGIAEVLPLGTRVVRGQPLATVHAADAVSAEDALRGLAQSIQLGDSASPAPLIHAVIGA
jgi:thymidine phosphorylase